MARLTTKNLTYFRSLLFMLIIPEFIIGYFVFSQIRFIDLIPFLVGIMFLGASWDIWAIPHGGKDRTWIWRFNPEETIGVKLLDLPIEEYIFFLAAGLYIIFFWEGIRLAAETSNLALYILLPSLSLWSLAAILFPARIHLRKFFDS